MKSLVSSVFIVLCISSVASAQTISFGDAVSGWAQLCGADVEAHCKGIRAGDGRLAGCLQQKASPACKRATIAFAANMKARLTAQRAAPELCEFDVQRHCASQKQGQARVLRCLMRSEHFRTLQKPCKQALEAAGWLDEISVRAD